MKIYLKEIRERYPEYDIINFNEEIFFENINHDSRVKLSNALFIPIIGKNFDGHDFITNSFENGCIVSLVQKDHYRNVDYGKSIILVDDVMRGLVDIVKLIRGKISVPIVAISGSTGKTTTREMLATILSSKGKVLNSDRNFNTLWGNAQILCKYENENYVVLELGMDRKGEIMEQCEAINPDMGILLNVGYAHAMQLGGIENVYLAEKELADYLLKNSRTTFINIDDERLSRMREESKVKTYGLSSKAEVMASKVKVTQEGTSFDINIGGSTYNGRLNIFGKGYVYNALSALSVCRYLGMDMANSLSALEQYSGFKGRFEIVKKSEDLIVINDAYNANPTSMDMSLETFNTLWGARSDWQKILVLGDMKELGDITQQMHSELGKKVSKMGVQKVYYVGEYYEYFKIGAHIHSLNTLVEDLKDQIFEKKSVILFKASNSINLQSVIEML